MNLESLNERRNCTLCNLSELGCLFSGSSSWSFVSHNQDVEPEPVFIAGLKKRLESRRRKEGACSELPALCRFQWALLASREFASEFVEETACEGG